MNLLFNRFLMVFVLVIQTVIKDLCKFPATFVWIVLLEGAIVVKLGLLLVV